jgi:hypothetical protein
MEDFDFVRCIEELRLTIFSIDGGYVFHMGGELKIFNVDGWKPYALLCVVQTDSHPVERRHGVIGGSTPRSTAAFHCQQS